MLDKSIPYYDVLMCRDSGKPLPAQPLPEGFRFASFSSGDEMDWAVIETSVGEFDSVEEALSYFRLEYLPMVKELERRCFFVVADDGSKVGTFTLWWNYTDGRRDPWVHWVAVKPSHQGFGLGKALVAEGMRRGIEMEGDRAFYLHTQTWSYKAMGIYFWSGFERTREKGLSGYANDDYDKATDVLKGVLKDELKVC
jgi:GNAT superfamily N-acetyltransferase